MKTIIYNKVYDTDTAHKIGVYGNNSDSSFDDCTETLFRKRTGEYFLYGEGGAHTIYGRHYSDNSIGYGRTIEPLTFEQAKSWAAEHLSKDAYDAEFGEIKEDNSMTVLYLNLPSALAERLRRSAREKGLGIGDYILSQLQLADSITSGERQETISSTNPLNDT